MPLRCVIFDLDGVLCRYDLSRRLARLAALSARAPAEIQAAIWGSGFEDRSDAGAFDAEHYLREFGERIGVSLSRSEWIAARAAGMAMDATMLALVRDLSRRLDVGLLSNNGWLLRESLPQLAPELPALFGPRLFVSAEFGVTKPDPEVFRRLAARVAMAPADLLLVDDNAANVAGAVAAGWQGHHFRGRESFERWLAGAGRPMERTSSSTAERAS